MLVNKLSQNIVLLTAFFLFSFSCNKNKSAASVPESEFVTARPGNPPPPVHGVCDYDLNETVLTNAGWVKSFEDNFQTDLSKWNIWTGGAFNNELQMYLPANLSLSSGNLVITAR